MYTIKYQCVKNTFDCYSVKRDVKTGKSRWFTGTDRCSFYHNTASTSAQISWEPTNPIRAKFAGFAMQVRNIFTLKIAFVVENKMHDIV